MKKILFTTLLALTALEVHAEFAGEFERISGPAVCSSGTLQIKTNQKAKERMVLLGSQLSWTLTLEDKGQSKEVVEGGCTYNVSYEKKEDNLQVKTERTLCPDLNENGVISESLELVKDKLAYKYEFISQNQKKTTYGCNYERKK